MQYTKVVPASSILAGHCGIMRSGWMWQWQRNFCRGHRRKSKKGLRDSSEGKACLVCGKPKGLEGKI